MQVGVAAGLPVSAGGHALPEEPYVTIRPGKRKLGFDLRELWHYRELLYFLTWRDVKIRYKQTLLGAAWAVIQPLFMMVVATVFFGKLAGISSDGLPYPVFSFAGLLPWYYVQNAVTSSGNSLVGNSNLITKVYFPRIIIPGSAVVAGVVDFLIALAMLAVLMAYYQIAVTWSVLLIPVLLVLTAILALGVGLGMSALNVRYRDIRYALPFMIQVWMFATPIIYPASEVSVKWRWLLALNQLAGIIEGYRDALFGRPMEWTTLGISAAVAVALLVFAAHAFWRTEKSFADVI